MRLLGTISQCRHEDAWVPIFTAQARGCLGPFGDMGILLARGPGRCGLSSSYLRFGEPNPKKKLEIKMKKMEKCKKK